MCILGLGAQNSRSWPGLQGPLRKLLYGPPDLIFSFIPIGISRMNIARPT